MLSKVHLVKTDLVGVSILVKKHFVCYIVIVLPCLPNPMNEKRTTCTTQALPVLYPILKQPVTGHGDVAVIDRGNMDANVLFWPF